MKLSNKILLSLYAFILGSILTFVISFRVSIGDVQAVTTELKKTEKVIDLEAFETLNLSGDMYLEVEEGAKHSIRLEAYDQDELELMSIPVVENGELKIATNENGDKHSRRFKAFITTPKVKQITLNEQASIKLQKFRIDSLNVVASQDAVCVLNSIDVKVLDVKADNNAKIRSNSSDFTLIDLNLFDKAECQFRGLNSDEIKGKIMDRSYLRFSGDVAKLNVELDTEATLRKAN